MATVALNNRCEIAVRFIRVSDGSLVDPSTVRLKVRDPGMSITTYTHPNAQITKDGTGLYHSSILFDRPGRWLIRWEGLSTNEVSEETMIQVQGSEFYDPDGDELPDS